MKEISPLELEPFPSQVEGVVCEDGDLGSPHSEFDFEEGILEE